MKSLGILLSLLRLHLRFLPWYIWPLLAVILLLKAQITPVILNQWTLDGLGTTTRLSGPGFFSFILLGGAFCASRAGYAGGLIPAGEFLLSRSVLRPTVYFSRMVFYFIIILAAPLLEVYVASAKPDLRIEFFDISTQTQTAEASARLRFYQDQFPEGSVVHMTKSVGPHRTVHFDALVVPSGALLIARWDMLASIFIALTIQIGMFSASTSQNLSDAFYRLLSLFVFLILIYFFVPVFIVLMFPQYDLKITMFERAFFFFAHHEYLFPLYALEAFILVQWIALKRIKHFEVI